MKTGELIEVETPNLLDEQFDYNLPPRILFDGPLYEEIGDQLVRFDPEEALARDLVITDTTFRDGQQARPPYTVEQQVRLYDMMARLGGPGGVIRQTEFFLYTTNDRRTLEECRALGHRFPEITSWIRADKGDFRLVERYDGDGGTRLGHHGLVDGDVGTAASRLQIFVEGLGRLFQMILGVADGPVAIDWVGNFRADVGVSDRANAVGEHARFVERFDPHLPVFPAHDRDGVGDLFLARRVDGDVRKPHRSGRGRSCWCRCRRWA